MECTSHTNVEVCVIHYFESARSKKVKKPEKSRSPDAGFSRSRIKIEDVRGGSISVV